jgi:protein-S-isoprenylcysteine O-methyltransferase Ste14
MDQVRIEGQTYMRRSPLVVLGLVLITLGIYGMYWHWRANKDASLFLRDPAIRAGVSLLAVTLGWVVIVPPFISMYRTGERIERMERQAGVRDTISPA